MKNIKVITVFFLYTLAIFTTLNSDEFDTTYNERISIRERSDYRTYINGKYSGLTYREAELYLIEKQSSANRHNAYQYDGEAFIIQDTRKNMTSTVKKLDKIVEIKFEYAPFSQYALKHPYQPQQFIEDNYFPLFRNFPAIPNIQLGKNNIGLKWNGLSTVVVHPGNGFSSILVPTDVEYEYIGTSSYMEQPVHKIKAVYGLRNAIRSPYNQNLIKANGGREVEIFLDLETQNPIFIRERTIEEFTYSDGKTLKNTGTLLHFFKYENRNSSYAFAVPPSTTVNHEDNTKKPKTTPSSTKTNTVDNIASKIPKSDNYDVQKTNRGVRINLKNLRFKADKAVLLDGENLKLDQIAGILKKNPNAKYFVEGHTADIGQPENQKKLSQERALTIVNELTKMGIPELKFIYNGAGGTKPIAPNNTEENRSKNRRVEITIMQ